MDRVEIIKALIDYAKEQDNTLDWRLAIINEIQTKAKQYTDRFFKN